MNKILISVALIVIYTGLIYFLIPFAVKTEVVYVNTQILLSKYKGMEDAQKEYQYKVKLWQANVDTLENGLRNSIVSYEKERKSLSKREDELMRENLEQKRNTFLQYQQAINDKAREEEAKLTEGPINQINSFIEEYGKKKKYKMIFGTTSGNILYGEKGSDITTNILDELNAQYDAKKK